MATTLSHLIVRLDANIDGLTKGTDAATRSVQNMGRRMQKVGGVMSAAVTLPITAIGVAATKMASDAEEAANKFDVVMGDSAERVNARLKELHTTIPLTTAQMRGLSAGLQDMLVPMGVARSEAADMSANFLELAGDIGSFNNVSPDRVLEGIASALAGQSEPLRRYGIDVSKARLETLAYANALVEEGEELTRTAQAQAIMLAIQADSTDAMGDAARTADSAANSFKFLKRDAGELAITIGNILLPIVVPMVQRLTEALQVFQNLSPTTQKVVVAVAALAAAFGPLLLALGTIMTLAPAITAGFVALTGPVGLAVASFAALTAAGVLLYQNWDKITGFVGRMVEAIRDALVTRFNAIVESVRGKVKAVGDFFGNLYDRVVGNSYIPDLIDGIEAQFARLDEVMVQPALKAAQSVSGAFGGISGPNLTPVTAIGTGAPPAAAVGGPIAQVSDLFGKLLPSLGPMAVLFEIIKGAMEPLEPVIEALREPLQIVGMLIGQTLAPVLELLIPIVELVAIAFTYAQEATGWFIKGLGWLIDKLIGWFTDWGEKLEAFGQDMIDNSRAAREMIGATEETTDGLNALNDAVVGMVAGFKVAAHRFAATAPGSPATVPGGSTTPGRPGEREKTKVASVSLGTINIQTSGDGRETYRNLYDQLDQRTRGDADARALFHAFPAPA